MTLLTIGVSISKRLRKQSQNPLIERIEIMSNFHTANDVTPVLNARDFLRLSGSQLASVVSVMIRDFDKKVSYARFGHNDVDIADIEHLGLSPAKQRDFFNHRSLFDALAGGSHGVFSSHITEQVPAFRSIPGDWQFSALEWMEIIQATIFSRLSVTMNVDDVAMEDVSFVPVAAEVSRNKNDFVRLIREHNDLSRGFIVADKNNVDNFVSTVTSDSPALAGAPLSRIVHAYFVQHFVDNFNHDMPLKMWLELNYPFSADNKLISNFNGEDLGDLASHEFIRHIRTM